MTRLAILARRARLDRALADGADPGADEALAARAAQLASPASRARLALGLERVLEAADEPPITFSAAAPLNRPAIHANRPLLRALAHELRGDAAVRAAGVARVRRLLVDGAGPLYAPASVSALAREAGAALDALYEAATALRLTA